jgi:hypothetical protein
MERPPIPLHKQFAHLELTFSPNVELISVVRTFVKQFYDRVLEDADLTWRLALAAHELLENAVKFAVDNTTRLHLQVQREQAAVVVRIMTKNRASAETIEGLHETIRGIRASADPVAHYQTMMRASIRRASGSGLGLGRIQAEAMLQLEYSVDGDAVELRATGRHPIPQEAPQ